jgi:hypothetical protein
VPFGEVLGRHPPAASDADHDRAEIVDRKRDHPHRDGPSPSRKPASTSSKGPKIAVGANRSSASRRSGSSRATVAEPSAVHALGRRSCRAGPLGRRPTLQHSIRDAWPQQTSVTALLVAEVLPARSTAFTVNLFSPLAVA